MNVDGDIVNGGCNGEVLSNGVIGEKGVVTEVDEFDGVVNEGDYFSTTSVTKTVLMDSSAVSEGVGL